MLLVGVYGAVGIVPDDFTPPKYSRDWHLHRDTERYLGGYRRSFARKRTIRSPATFAMWKFGRTFSHSAILVGNGKIIHSYIGRGVVLDDIDQPELDGREVKFLHWRHLMNIEVSAYGLGSGSGGSGGGSYDDTAIKQELARIKQTLAALPNSAPYDDAEIKKELEAVKKQLANQPKGGAAYDDTDLRKQIAAVAEQVSK